MMILIALVFVGIIAVMFIGEFVFLCALLSVLLNVATNLDIVIDLILMIGVMLFLFTLWGPQKYTASLKEFFYR